jgi:hypothetical protein
VLCALEGYKRLHDLLKALAGDSFCLAIWMTEGCNYTTERGDRLAGLFIDELLAQAIAGGLVDLPDGDALGTRRPHGAQSDRRLELV